MEGVLRSFFFLVLSFFPMLCYNCHLFASEDVRNKDYTNINIKLKPVFILILLQRPIHRCFETRNIQVSFPL